MHVTDVARPWCAAPHEHRLHRALCAWLVYSTVSPPSPVPPALLHPAAAQPLALPPQGRQLLMRRRRAAEAGALMLPLTLQGATLAQIGTAPPHARATARPARCPMRYTSRLQSGSSGMEKRRPEALHPQVALGTRASFPSCRTSGPSALGFDQLVSYPDRLIFLKVTDMTHVFAAKQSTLRSPQTRLLSERVWSWRAAETGVRLLRAAPAGGGTLWRSGNVKAAAPHATGTAAQRSLLQQTALPTAAFVRLQQPALLDGELECCSTCSVLRCGACMMHLGLP